MKEEFYKQIAVECYKNSLQFLVDAELLLKNNSTGHAYALAILGLEEFAKSLVALFVIGGYYKTNSKEVKDAFTKHSFKHFVAAGIFSSNLFSKEVWKDKMGNLVIDKRKIPNLSKTSVQILEEFMELDKDKQKGFYVDVDFNSESIFTPKNIDKAKVDIMLTGFLNYINELGSLLIENLDIPSVMMIVKRVGKRMKKKKGKMKLEK